MKQSLDLAKKYSIMMSREAQDEDMSLDEIIEASTFMLASLVTAADHYAKLSPEKSGKLWAGVHANLDTAKAIFDKGFVVG